MKIRIFCEKMLRSPTSIVTKIYKLNQLRFLTIAVISFSCQENRLPEELDNDFKPSVVDAIISPVEIDFTSSPNVEENLVKNLIGTYSPQKWVNADKIYHKTNVLEPLSVPFHKVNLPNVDNIVNDGTWNDISDKGQPSQKTILNLLKSARVGIHLGIESVPRQMRGDAEKVQRLFSTAMTKVRNYVGNEEEIHFEILNEPELPQSVEWGYYPDFNLFWKDFLNAYIALANKRLTDPNLKIGGPGFELDGWLNQFINKLTDPSTNKVILSDGSTHTIDLDFISYHNYLNWDNAPIVQADTKSAKDKMTRFYNGIAQYRSTHPEVKLFCTEYSWLRSPFDSVNDAANNSYRHCARTLELTKLAVDELVLTDRFYWAQSMGQSAEFGDDYFTLENYDWDTNNYKYRAGYYAFWLYQKMPTKRYTISYDEMKLNGMASSANGKFYLVVWNITNRNQTVKFILDNINLADYKYHMYIIDSKSFHYINGNDKLPKITESGVASDIKNITLEKEATVYIEVF